MFLKPTILNALMKQAYKTGLVLANPKEEDALYIAGRYWEAEINPAFIPKRTLGDIIALAGEMPDRGTRFSATKEGNQMEMELPMRIKKGRFREGNSLTVPDFVTPDTHVDIGSIEQMTRKIAKWAGVEQANPHKFRRTCATLALRRGMPVEQVSKMLGHENLSTTQIYLDLTEDELAQAHKKYVV